MPLWLNLAWRRCAGGGGVYTSNTGTKDTGTLPDRLRIVMGMCLVAGLISAAFEQAGPGTWAWLAGGLGG